MEESLVEAKMSWAKLDMENDELDLKLQQMKKQQNSLCSNITKLEIDLVKAKQDLGEANN